MATPTENIQAALNNVYQQLADITASPKPTYSVGGRSVSHGEHFNNLLASRKELLLALQQVNGPFEVRSFGA